MSTSSEHIQTDKNYVIRKLEGFVRVKALEQYCASGSLSLVGLHQHINQNVPDASMLNQSSCLHLASMKKSISLDIVRFLLKLCPDAARQPSISLVSCYTPYGARYRPPNEAIRKALPLHLACLNDSCPPSVIELLLKTCPAAARQDTTFKSFMRHWFKAFPLHCYLSRGSNIDVGTIKVLVAAYPASLIDADNPTQCTPLQVILANPNFEDKIDVVQYIVGKEPASVRIANEQGELPLHIACSSVHINLEIIQLLVKVWPESINHPDSNGYFPIHCLCDFDNGSHEINPDIEILSLLIAASPELIRHSHGRNMLPIHDAASWNKHEYIKLLIDAYPESLRIESGEGMTPLHHACEYVGFETARLICNECPEALCDRTTDGLLPLHMACGADYVNLDLIKALLSTNPSHASEKTRDEKPRTYFVLPISG